MKLKDILPFISQNSNVTIWKEGRVISSYNGRDSIPVEHNEFCIEENGIYTENNAIHIFVYDKN